MPEARTAEREAGRRPCRAARWEERDRGVALLVPRYGRGLVGRALERWLAPRPCRIQLDEIGSFVWRRLDGRRTVGEIESEMRSRFGDRIEPAGPRLAQFLASLARMRALGEAAEAAATASSWSAVPAAGRRRSAP